MIKSATQAGTTSITMDVRSARPEVNVKIADIGGKKYAFDMYGRMLTGWITAAGENISDDSIGQRLHTTVTQKATEASLQTHGYTSALRTMTTRTITSQLTTSTSLPTVRRLSAQKTIGNVKYTFDDRGVAQDSWVHNSDKKTWKYYGDEEEPKLHTGWFEAIPSKRVKQQ